MKIVGVGAGPGLLTEEAIKTIENATLIYGSPRSIELVKRYIGSGSVVKVIEDYKALRSLPNEAVVLSTGDPLLGGLGYLKGEIVPGISSMQLACARLKVSLLKVVPVTFHGRKTDPELVAAEISRGKSVFILTDESTDMNGLCGYLERKGLATDVAVLTDLGYPEEKIIIADTSHPPRTPGLSCVIIGHIR